MIHLDNIKEILDDIGHIEDTIIEFEQHPNRHYTVFIPPNMEEYPELGYLSGVSQNPKWHNEGDVLHHTVMAIKQCEFLRYEMSLESEAIVRLAIMLHDIGKAVTGTYGSHRTHHAPHSAYSAILAHGFIKRCLPSIPNEMLNAIINIVRNHMRFPVNTTKIRRLGADLYPATIREWAAVCRCDMIGREPINYDTLRKIDNIVEVKERMDDTGPIDNNIVNGKFLILHGMTPGPNFKVVIDAGKKAQDCNVFDTNTGAIDWFNENYNDIMFEIEKK